MSAVDLPPIRIAREMPAPVMIEVITGNRTLRSLEPVKDIDQVTAWRDRAIFTIDEATGLVMCESQYGTFSYHWPPAYRSCDIFTFLASLDFDYFMKKAAKEPYREIDLDRTIANLREDLLRERRQRDVKKDAARDRWDALAAIAGEYPRTDDDFLRFWFNDSDLVGWFGGDIPSIYSRDTFSARHFWDVIWMTLIESEPFCSRKAPKEQAA